MGTSELDLTKEVPESDTDDAGLSPNTSFARAPLARILSPEEAQRAVIFKRAWAHVSFRGGFDGSRAQPSVRAYTAAVESLEVAVRDPSWSTRRLAQQVLEVEALWRRASAEYATYITKWTSDKVPLNPPRLKKAEREQIRQAAGAGAAVHEKEDDAEATLDDKTETGAGEGAGADHHASQHIEVAVEANGSALADVDTVEAAQNAGNGGRDPSPNTPAETASAVPAARMPQVRRTLKVGASWLPKDIADLAPMEAATKAHEHEHLPSPSVSPAGENDQAGDVRLVHIADIHVPKDRLRGCGDITSLKESIEERGLLEPILLRRRNRRLELVAGLQRLEAKRALGHIDILGRIINATDIEAALIEVDENLARVELSVLERAEHIGRRKQLYEAMHPEVKHGGAPGQSGGGKQKAKGARVASFAADTAHKTNLSPRTIQEDTQIYKMSPDAKKLVRGTVLEDQKRALLSIARLPVEQQAAKATALLNGKLKTTALTTRGNTKGFKPKGENLAGATAAPVINDNALACAREAASIIMGVAPSYRLLLDGIKKVDDPLYARLAPDLEAIVASSMRVLRSALPEELIARPLAKANGARQAVRMLESGGS